jgi:hypothetical protein
VLAAGAALFLGLLAYSAVWRRHGLLTPAVGVLVAAGMVAALRAARVAPAVIAVVLAGLGLHLVYFGWTDAMQRNPDVASQLFYVDYLVTHHAPPPNDACTTCHHPPLFYLALALVQRLLQWARVGDLRSGLQAAAFVVSSIFVLFSTLTISRLAPRRWQQVLATALVVFWPYTVLNSVRIHNDVGLYAVAAVVFHLLVRWTEAGKRWRLILACALAFAGLYVKANAVILVLLCVAVAALRLRRAADRRARLREVAPVLGVLLCLTAAHGFLRGEHAAGLAKRLLGSAYAKAPAELTPRTARYYLTFDPRPLLTRPFAVALEGRSAEPSYWNHLVQSSLFGTRNRIFLRQVGAEPENPTLAVAATWAFLGLLAALLVAFGWTLRDASPTRTLLLATTAVWVVVGLAFHLLVPAGHHADFRFIFPVLVPVSLLYVDAVAGVRRRAHRLWAVWVGVAALFMAANAACFLPVTVRHVPVRREHARAASLGQVPLLPGMPRPHAPASGPAPLRRLQLLPRPLRPRQEPAGP